MNAKIKNSVFSLYFLIIAMFLIYIGGIGVEAHENALSALDYVTMDNIGDALGRGISEEDPAPTTSGSGEASTAEKVQMWGAAAASVGVLIFIPLITLAAHANEYDDD